MSVFKFPDEIEAEQPDKAEKPVEDLKADSAPEIEVVDDTPEEDRGRTPMKEPPAEVTDDELSSYDEKVQSRIKKFTKGYHDERRAKEQAMREREAAEAYARQIFEENRKLQGYLAAHSQTLTKQTKDKAAMRLASAQKGYKEAYESGDAEAIAKAQTEIAEATWELKAAERARPYQPPLQPQQNVVQPVQQSSNSNLTDKDRSWLETNTWFGPDQEMTATALGLHQKLLSTKGEAYIGTDDYYKTVDATMRKRFPEYFGSNEELGEPQPKTPDPAGDEPRRAVRQTSVVAPATRSTPSNRIRLTASQASIARRIGVPLEEYARHVALLNKGS